jgi:hypothetical protein
MSFRHFERRSDLAQRTMSRRRVPPALSLDNDIVRLEKAGLLVAAGLAGVSVSAVAAFLLAGFESALSFALPAAVLGWLLSVVAALQE